MHLKKTLILLSAIILFFGLCMETQSQEKDLDVPKVPFVIKRVQFIKQTIKDLEAQEIYEPLILQKADQLLVNLEHELEQRLNAEILSFYPSIGVLLLDKIDSLKSATTLADLKNKLDDFLTHISFSAEPSGYQRFLNSEYYVNWLETKVEEYNRIILELIQEQNTEKNPSKKKTLEAQIAHYQILRDKVKTKLKKPIFVKGEYHYNFPDKLMGIEFLHSRNLLGKTHNLQIKILDTTDNIVHQFWQPEVMDQQNLQDLTDFDDHAIHVAGTIATWPRTTAQRKGIAPESNIENISLGSGYSGLYGSMYKITIIEPSTLFLCQKQTPKTISLPPNTTIEFDGRDFPKYLEITKPGEINVPLMPYLLPDHNNDCSLGKTKSINAANDLLMGNNLRGKYIVTDFMIAEYNPTIAMAKYLDYLTVYMENSNIQYLINFSQALVASPLLLKSIGRFIKAGGVMVIAAGNSTNPTDGNGYIIRDTNNLPASQDIISEIGFKNWLRDNPDLQKGVLFVGNLEYSMKKLSHTSIRAKSTIENRYICAWGSNVISTVGSRSVDIMSGTSMAAPTVTGIIAVLKGAFPHIPIQEIAQIILNTANQDYLEDYSSKTYGAGIIDGAAAYTALEHLGADFSNPNLLPTSSKQSDITEEKKILIKTALAEYQYAMSELYFYDHDTRKNYSKALHWLTLSAKNGNENAQVWFGELLLYGEDLPDSQGKIIPPDMAKGIYWLEQAAIVGNSQAKETLESLQPVNTEMRNYNPEKEQAVY